MMTILVVLGVFNAGFLAGCWWAGRTRPQPED